MHDTNSYSEIMKVSQYFERTLFYDRSPAADEYYERSAGLIFENDISGCRIEVCYQSCRATLEHTTVHPGGNGNIERDSKGSRESWKEKSLLDGIDSGDGNKVYDSDGDFSLSGHASSTELPDALDQRRGESNPPLYPGRPKLTIHALDVTDISTFSRETKHNFRVFYVRQRHSHSRLQITKNVFEELLRSCHAFPRFNEYLIGFGSKHSENEVGPPPLKFRALYKGRSTNRQGFECSYILRYVEFTDRPNKKPWSLRQFAVYHRYKQNCQRPCSTWILVGASQRTEARLDHYTRSIEDLMRVNPFELHVIFLDTAIATWRPYLVYLTQLVETQSNKALGMVVSCESGETDFVTLQVEDHQALKQIEDEIADMLLCLDSTLDTVSTFLEMYDRTSNSQLESIDIASSISHSFDIIAASLREKTKEVSYTRKKAEALLSKVQNTRTLISSLLERQSGSNINQQIAALRALELQGQTENAIMRQIAEKSSRDSSSMKILTIITMIYLPCTIVSNFYSTQFVSQRESDDGNKTLEYAKNSWIFFAISIPLTLFTLTIWFTWVNSDRLLQLALQKADRHRQDADTSARLFRRAKLSVGLPF